MTERRVVLVTRSMQVSLFVSWFAILAVLLWTWSTAATVASLNQAVHRINKTDLISCQFLNADATTRLKQNKSTRINQLRAESFFIRDVDLFLALFSRVKSSGPNAAGIRTFTNYIRSERDLVISIRDGSAQNIVYSQQLATLGRRLANQLHC
jgi:hypothetical protein